MNLTSLLILAGLSLQSAWAQIPFPPELPRVPAAKATNWQGQKVVIQGKLAEWRASPNNARILLEDEYPEHACSIRLPQWPLAGMTNLTEAVGRRIEICGEVDNKPGRPSLILTNASQLRLGDWEKPPANLAEEIELRAAALAAALTNNADLASGRYVGYLTCYSSAREVVDGVAHVLPQLHLIRRPNKLPPLTGGTEFDRERGKYFLFCTVKVVTRTPGEAELQIDCREHSLKGIGMAVSLKKIDGHWRVASCVPNWIS